MSDKPAINTSERLFDLVRYMRAELHEADLISDEEYFWLCSESPMANSPKGGSPSRERLEEYDEMRERIETLERENAAMREAIRVSLIRAYTAGYQHGHEATVEGEFIPVHSSDETEFHAENIHHLMHDGSLPELQPFLKP